MPEYYDAIVVGAGPAGLSAAVRLAEIGRSVTVFERAERLSNGPGETLHPGAEVIINQLGIGDRIRSTACLRPSGIIVERDGVSDYVPYGRDWKGFQIRRYHLNAALADRLDALGGRIQYATPAIALFTADKLVHIQTVTGTTAGRWLFDASGVSGWLDRRRKKRMMLASPRRWLRYGYRPTTTEETSDPILRMNNNGWSWTAPLGDGESAWVELSNTKWLDPPSPSSLGADGTWRIAITPAEPNIFRVGDAACRLDPGNSHGVLRAMMSAIMATDLAIRSENGAIDVSLAAHAYNQWISRWFSYDAAMLRSMGM